MKLISLGLLFYIVAAFSSGAHAIDPIYTPLFSDKAIRGYDTVAYFTKGKAVKGDKQFATQYKGATWLFESQEHLDLFVASPEKYAPQYGGYCAYAVAQNTTASIQPELFTIHEGKLYLNFNQHINDKWLGRKESFITQADKNWPAILNK